MAGEEQKDPKQIVKEQLWAMTTNAFVLAVAFGAGVFLGYSLWGEAPALEKKLQQRGDQLARLKNERSDLEGKVAVIDSRYEGCKDELKGTKEALKAAKSAAAAATSAAAE